MLDTENCFNFNSFWAFRNRDKGCALMKIFKIIVLLHKCTMLKKRNWNKGKFVQMMLLLRVLLIYIWQLKQTDNHLKRVSKLESSSVVYSVVLSIILNMIACKNILAVITIFYLSHAQALSIKDLPEIPEVQHNFEGNWTKKNELVFIL